MNALTNNHGDLRCLAFKYCPKTTFRNNHQTWLPKNETALVYNFLWTKEPYWTARHLFRESCEKVGMFSFRSTAMRNSNKTITGHRLNRLFGCSCSLCWNLSADLWGLGGNWETRSLAVPCPELRIRVLKSHIYLEICILHIISLKKK